MPYNYKQVQTFIDKVNAEAQAEAQKVYDKYNKELIKRIQAQLKEGDTAFAGMGTGVIYNSKDEEVGEKLGNILGALQYTPNLTIGFDLPTKFNKEKC